jgi:hypothetical protein
MYSWHATLIVTKTIWTDLDHQIVRLTWWKQQIQRIGIYPNSYTFLYDTSRCFSFYLMVESDDSLF